MQMKVADVIQNINDENYDAHEMAYTFKELTDDKRQDISEQLVHAMAVSLKNDRMFDFSVQIDAEVPFLIRFQANIINLPYADVSKTANFFENEQEMVPVKVYSIAEGEAINVSGLRIDEFATPEMFSDDTEQLEDEVNEIIERWSHVVTENLLREEI